MHINTNKNNVQVKRFGYTHQVANPDKFLRFDLVEGNFSVELKTAVKTWLRQIPIECVMHFPEKNVEVLDLLSRWFAVAPSNIAVSNGSDSIIEVLPKIFLRKGDRAVVVVPAFFRFIEAMRRVGVEPNFVKLNECNDFVWTKEITLQILAEAKDDKVKLIWLASPNNPTGQTISSIALEEIINTGKVVILDTALNGLPAQMEKELNLLTRGNLILLSSFSKVLGLAGLRFGFSISSPEITTKINEWLLPFDVSGPTLFLVKRLLIDLLRTKTTTKDQNFFEEKRRLVENLSRIDRVKVINNPTTNFIMLRQTNNLDLFSDLKQKGVLVADLNDCPGIENEGFIRITAKDKESNNKLIEIIRNI